MDNCKKQNSKSLIGKLYGGLNMSWPTVIAFAVFTAILTAVFLIVPLFQDSSFQLMGVQYEAWIFFAIIIIANCKKPLEAALKTFVFFLISQPLIYLLQVPFSWMGWGLFGYYRFWFILTLLTLPAAFIAWYITKRNWLSLLILAPVFAYLGMVVYNSALRCLHSFPHLLLTAVFCLMQIVLYAVSFLPGRKKLAGFAVSLLVVVFLGLTSSPTEIDTRVFLPDDPLLSDAAVLVLYEDPGFQITLENADNYSMIHIRSTRFGSADFRIRDGEREYLYTVQIYEDAGGHSQIQILPQQDPPSMEDTK